MNVEPSPRRPSARCGTRSGASRSPSSRRSRSPPVPRSTPTASRRRSSRPPTRRRNRVDAARADRRRDTAERQRVLRRLGQRARPVHHSARLGDGGETLAVVKSGADPIYGVAFIDVANLYADGCRWTLVEPPVGTDRRRPRFRVREGARTSRADRRRAPSPSTASTGSSSSSPFLDYAGGRLQGRHVRSRRRPTTPARTPAQGGGSELLGRRRPNQQNQAMILDVDGARLVIFTGHPPDISAQDRADLDAIVASLQIG